MVKAQELIEENDDIAREYKIVMFERGIRLNHTGAIISLHKTYIDCTQFTWKFR